MPSTFADRLRSARELRKWSQQDLAQRTGLQATAISHFETGNRSPSFENLRKLAEALNVTTDYLLGRDEKPGLVGEEVTQLFRKVEKMTAADLTAMDMMAQALLAKNKKEGK